MSIGVKKETSSCDTTDPSMAPDPPHHETPEEEQRIREAALDDTIEATFPASDPPSTIPNPDDHIVVSDEQPIVAPENDA
jgi:hypothetical protein